MAQDKNLPEGTDKIIGGASAGGSAGTGEGEGGTVIVETTLVTEEVIPAPMGDVERRPTGGRSRGSEGAGGSANAQGGGRLKDKVRASGEKLSGQAADKARGLVEQGLERSGEALTNVSRLIGDTAPGLEERLGGEYADYARRAAETIDNLAQSIRTKDPDELIDDTRAFVRKSPGVALAGAAIVGFALARLVKSGLDANRGESSGTSGSGAGRDGRDGGAA